MSQANDVVIDRTKASWSDLWKTEDYWAIWIGFFILAVALFFSFQMRPTLQPKVDALTPIIKAEEAKTAGTEVKTIAWYVNTAERKKIQAVKESAAIKAIIDNLKTPARWKSNPMEALVLDKATADARNVGLKEKIEKAKAAEKETLEKAKLAEDAAAAADFKDAELNATAKTAIDAWQKAHMDTNKVKSKEVKPFNRIPGLIILGLGLGVLMTIGAVFIGKNPVNFFLGFMGVYLLCVLANILGNQVDMRKYGLNAEIWSILLGMIIANTVSTPKWLKYSAEVEYFIKTGLVLLGAEVLFSKIMAIGIPGIFVAWVVTPIVLVCTYIFGQKVLKMPSKTLNMTISADMSVCGTSAAIATASACRAKKEELTLSLGLSLAFTAIMMVAMPGLINLLGLPEVLGGAWIGGTVDSTGAVAAAGAFVGPKAMQVAATIKMIQNVLIGVTAFFVAIYFTTKVENNGQQVGVGEIWNRFPKFVIGFAAVSIIFSMISSDLGPMAGALVDNGTNKISVPLRGWYFALAFISIGLTTNFRELGQYFKGGKPIILYVCGQTFNIVLTLAMAYVMFYKVFPEITAKI